MSSPCPQCGNFNRPNDTQCLKCGMRLATTKPLAPILAPPQTSPTSYYSCPYCGSHFPPQIVQRISALGWVVFVVGLLFCLIGAFFSLLFKEEIRMCPSCRGNIDRYRIPSPQSISTETIPAETGNKSLVYIGTVLVALALVAAWLTRSVTEKPSPTYSAPTLSPPPTLTPTPTPKAKAIKRKRVQNEPLIIQRASPEVTNSATPLQSNRGTP